jgi:Fic family protein
MKESVDWFNQSVSEERHHPLILIGIFIVVFLAIHPFKDGNGRLSRIITTLLLLRAGYGYVPYSSMEGIIEANKDNYYLALRRTRQTIRKEKQNWEYWLVCFLQSMAKQKDKLAAKVNMSRPCDRPCRLFRARYWSSPRPATKSRSRK